MATEDQQLLSALNSMKQSLERLVAQGSLGVRTSGTGGTATSSRSSNTLDDVQLEKIEREQRKEARNLGAYNRTMKTLIASSKALAAASEARSGSELKVAGKLSELSKSVDPFNKVVDQLTVEYNKLARHSLPAQNRAFKGLVKGTDILSGSLSKSFRSSSLMSAAMLKRSSEINQDESSIQYGMYIDDLKAAIPSGSKAMQDLMKSAEMMEQTIDEFGNTINDFKDNINIEDFARLRALMGEASVRISEAFHDVGGVDVGALLSGKTSFEKLLGQDGPGHEISQSIAATAISMRQLGVSFGDELDGLIDAVANGTGDILEINKRLPSVSAKLDDLTSSFSKTIPVMDRLAVQANTLEGSVQRFFLKGGWVDKMQQLGTPAGLMGSFGTLKVALDRLMKDLSSFNIAQVPNSFYGTLGESIRYGMSMEDTTKFIQDNKRIYSMYGADAFSVMRTGLEDTFNKFGYTFEQAAGVIGPATEAAIASGINVRDSKVLSGFINDTMDSFQRISGIVNVTAEDFAKMNAELFNSPEVLNHMLGLTSAQANAYRKSLTLQREELTVRTGSLQIAQDILKAQESQKRGKVLDRFKDSAKLAQRMMVLGYGGQDILKATRIAQKGQATTSPEEKAWMTELLTGINKKSSDYVTSVGGDAGLEQMRQIQMEATALEGTGFDAWFNATQKVAVSDKANAGLTQAEQERAIATAKGNVAVAEFQEMLNTVSSLLKNSVAATAIAAGAALIGLTISAGSAARMLGAIGGKGMLGDLLGKGKGLGGKIGSVGGKALGLGGKLLKGGGLVGLGGLAVGMGGDALSSAGYTKSGAAASTLGSMAAWAGTGAMIGSVIPGVGTLIGGAVGGLGGLGASIYDGTAGQMFGSPTSTVARPAAPTMAVVKTPEQLTVANPVNTGSIKKPSADDIAKVSDDAARQQLVLMSSYLQQMLQLMTDSTKGSRTDFLVNPATRFTRDLNTVPSYMTGRTN